MSVLSKQFRDLGIYVSKASIIHLITHAIFIILFYLSVVYLLKYSYELQILAFLIDVNITQLK